MYYNFCSSTGNFVSGLKQPVYRFASNWKFRGSISCGNEIFQNGPERPLPPASFATGNETFPSANKQVRDVDYQAPPSTKFMHE